MLSVVNEPHDPHAAYLDASGHLAPIPADHGQRRMPEEGFFTGPEIGGALPGFELMAASGRLVDLHRDRGNAKAAVVFFRSAVW